MHKNSNGQQARKYNLKFSSHFVQRQNHVWIVRLGFEHRFHIHNRNRQHQENGQCQYRQDTYNNHRGNAQKCIDNEKRIQFLCYIETRH